MASSKKKNSDILYQRLLDSGKLPALLRGLGVFLKDHAEGSMVPNTLWTGLGYSEDDMLGEKWREYVHPEDRVFVFTEWDRVYRGESDAWSGEFRLRSALGEWHHIRHRTFVLARNETSIPTLVIGVDIDDTDLNQDLHHERSLRLDAERRILDSETLLLASAVTVSSLDYDTTFEHIVAQARSILHFDACIAWRSNDHSMQAMHHGGLGSQLTSDATAGAMAGLVQGTLKPLVLYGTDAGASFGATWSARFLIPLVARGECLAVLEFLVDQRHEPHPQSLRQAMAFSDLATVAVGNALQYKYREHQALTDWLTGLGTRRKFDEVGSACLAAGGTQWACLMVDMDWFKGINDSLGHQAGDEVLRAVAKVVQATVRESDLVCRYGGEEFVVLMACLDLESALKRAEDIRQAVASLEIPGYQGLQTTVSIGISWNTSTGRDGHGDLLSMVKHADEALYRAKTGGRNRVEGPFKSSEDSD